MAAPVERIDLWVVDLDRWAGTAPDLDGLTGEDRTQAARLRDPVAAHRLLARRSVTRSLLADALGINGHRLEIGRHCPSCGGSDHGRPFVRNAGIEFSVSSSGPIAAIAVSDQPVGVDIEQPRIGIIPVPNALSARERRAIDSLDGPRQGEAFLRLWTAKEAVLKASGRGLGDDLARIDVADLLGAESATVACDGRTWVVRHLPADPGAGGQPVVAIADPSAAAVVRRTVATADHPGAS